MEWFVIRSSRDGVTILVAVVRGLVRDTHTVKSRVVGARARVALTISGKLRNSDVSDFWKLRTLMFFVISHLFMYFTFHLWLRSFPLFHVIILTYVLRSLSVPGTYLSHSLVYKHLYSVDRITRIKITIPLALVLLVLSLSSLLVTCFPDLEIPTLTRTRKSGIPEGFHREQGNTLSLPR